MRFHFRPLLLLPAVAIFIAAAILWGGVVLSKQVRVERVAGDGTALATFSSGLQEEIHSLENRYRDHLETLCRGDLDDSFTLRDSINAIVGVRQISTLDTNGQVEQHLLASEVEEDEAVIPLPVFDQNRLPVGRRHPFVIEDPASFNGTKDGTWGWLGSGSERFYFSKVSERRTVFVLINPEKVTASIKTALIDRISAQMTGNFAGVGSVSLTLDGRTVASVGAGSDEEPDLIHELGSRFSNWRVLSRDPRREIVEYDLEVLTGATLLALLVALAGGIAFFHLNRALRLAERRVSFVNQVSHELKTPLTNILLNTDLALDGADANGQRRLAMVQEETRRLSRLIDNVLTYSLKHDEPVALGSRRQDLLPLIEEVLAQFRPSLERRGITIRIEAPEAVLAIINPDAFSQILGNLLSNIEKYAASGGLARIELGRDGGETILRICDAGPGIPRSERERIFLPFHRLDDRTAEGASGTGLGLAIARDLAGRMDGSLRVLPAETGATFELRLPSGVDEKVIDFPEVRAS